MTFGKSIRNPADFAAGLTYMVVGGGAAWGATLYRIGTATRLGPGYFPFCLGLLLVLMGLIVLIGSLRPGAEAGPKPHWNLPALLFVLGAVLAFALLLTTFGVVVSTVVMVAIASFASPQRSWRSALVLMVILGITGPVLFAYALEVRLPIMPLLLGH